MTRDDDFKIFDAPAASFGQSLFGLSRQQLVELVSSFSQPAYRGRQLAAGLYKDWYTELSAFSSLPKELREQVAKAGFSVDLPSISQSFRSADGTERYLVTTRDGQSVETVWMPEGDGGERGEDSGRYSEQVAARRATICVSSQIGCAVNCSFCLTARLGLKRNLTAGEIAGQVVSVLQQHHIRIGRARINLVFMGMGEPFLNYDAFMDAVRLLVEEVGLPESRMTVSTSGIVPGILRFAGEAIRPRLAISLNAPDDQVRESIMPITRKWPIAEVIAAAQKVPLRARERITFEYVLLGGVTDRPEHAAQVARLLRQADFPSKVNLIAWNPGPGADFVRPHPAAVESFQQSLIAAGIPAFVRRPRGLDIYAACGQLKQTVSAG